MFSFAENQCVGIKKFLMREDMARLDVALSNQRRLVREMCFFLCVLNWLIGCCLILLHLQFITN